MDYTSTSVNQSLSIFNPSVSVLLVGKQNKLLLNPMRTEQVQIVGRM